MSAGFLCKQNIAPYAQRRNFNVDRWFTKQKVGWSEMYAPAKLSTNKKVDFCREMIQEEARYRLMRNGLEKRQQALLSGQL